MAVHEVANLYLELLTEWLLKSQECFPDLEFVIISYLLNS